MNSQKYNEFHALYTEAQRVGWEAGRAITPRPMKVEGWPVVADGLCGFASVNIRDGRKPFCKWLVASGLASKDTYHGGISIWISDHNQSYERKGAHAKAMAAYLREHGYTAYVYTELD